MEVSEIPLARTRPRQSIQKREPEFHEIVTRIVDAALQHKAFQVRAYDVRGLTLIADSFVICSASSEPQMKAIRSSVIDAMREIGKHALHVEGEPDASWVVLDYGDVIFHLFRNEARDYYDLDGLWADAPQMVSIDK